MRRHHDEQRRPVIGFVRHTVVFAGRSNGNLPRRQWRNRIPDLDVAGACERNVDFVVGVVRMRFLRLAGFETLYISEQFRRFVEIHFLHLFG